MYTQNKKIHHSKRRGNNGKEKELKLCFHKLCP